VTDAVGATDGAAPLSVAAEVTVTVAGTTAEVRSTGERIFVSFPSLVGAIRALRTLPEGGETVLDDLLATTDLTVELRVHDRTVAVAGVGADPGFVSKELGFGPVELRLGGALGAVGQEVTALVRSL
jgi:hypothetical protein